MICIYFAPSAMYCEMLNVINDDPKASIILNNQTFSQSLFNHDISPGTHYLKVMVIMLHQQKIARVLLIKSLRPNLVVLSQH